MPARRPTGATPPRRVRSPGVARLSGGLESLPTAPLPGHSPRRCRGPAKTDRTRLVRCRRAGSVSFGGEPRRPFEFASALEAALAGPRSPASRDALVPQNGSRSVRSPRRSGSNTQWRPGHRARSNRIAGVYAGHISAIRKRGVRGPKRGGNHVGTGLGIPWERGNRTGFPRRGTQVPAHLDLRVSRAFEPVWGCGHAFAGRFGKLRSERPQAPRVPRLDDPPRRPSRVTQ
jgi:hypothetical protein